MRRSTISPPGAGCFGAKSGRATARFCRKVLLTHPNCDYLAPSLAVDANGNIGLGCTRTSETEFPSVYVMMHAANDPKNTMRPPVLAAKGTTVFSSNRPQQIWTGMGKL